MIADGRRAVATRHREPGRRLLDSGGKAGLRILQGELSDLIARTDHEGDSLIIAGKHGRNWVADKIIASTAAKVCEISRHPVLMMPLQKE